MIQLHRSTESTNDLALTAVEEGAPHGSCWVADRQTAGRGRREIGGERRDWFSPDRSNIYMSILLRPELAPSAATHMTLAAAVGAADALVEETDLEIWIKWPNDLYLGTRKLGGILTEAETSGGALDAVVVGLGVNVNVSADRVPDELQEEMTSLEIGADRAWDRLPLIFALRDGIVERCDAFVETGMEGLIDEVQAYDQTPDHRVEIRRNGRWVEGIARGVGPDGHLVVEIDGDEVSLQAGEARFPDL